ncbi:hypothetical protein A3J98_00890 [candidate division WS6 bacterium RIFOXYC1_FULL_33_10]|uniref:Uncharacterized protein n=2 Tax=Candidatus Dojkabacteria TaxID=74243 RepID=A0A1F4UJB0_9BACT|nr:MAG: hypothetical protein A3J98_00890 [candidate division WS6 bacterium RIFOXYC1_FULL_33_10]
MVIYMVRKTDDIQQLKILLEIQFKSIEKQLKEYDRNILKILRKLNTQKKYSNMNQYSEDVEIKVRSYMDGDMRV